MKKLEFDKQIEILAECIKTGMSLGQRLTELNFSYDSLVYESNMLQIQNGFRYEYLEDMPKKKFGIPAISFFSGAGGFDIGFSFAGFETQAFLEHNEIFCNTLRKNFPDTPVIGPPDFSGDAREKDENYSALRDEIKLSCPFEGIFFGGPPCQSFSIAANQRFSKKGENFKRVGFGHEDYGSLVSDYVWYIKQFLPKAFVIENVPGLFEMDEGKRLRDELAELSRLGYHIAKPHIINVADYGVPQNRHRLFIIGARDISQAPVFPRPNKQKIPCQVVFEKSLEGVENHETREHLAQSILRYCRLGYDKRDQLGRVDRLHPLKPSKTIIAGGNKGGGRSHLHPFIPRTLSVRESARLQTFPDRHVFTGPVARQFTQVGNAVPPLFALRLAEQIRDQIFLGKIPDETKAVQLSLEFGTPPDLF